MFYIIATKHFQCRSLNAAIIEDTSATLQSMLIHIIKVYKGNLLHTCKIEFDHRNLTGVLQHYPLP